MKTKMIKIIISLIILTIFTSIGFVYAKFKYEPKAYPACAPMAPNSQDRN